MCVCAWARMGTSIDHFDSYHTQETPQNLKFSRTSQINFHDIKMEIIPMEYEK